MASLVVVLLELVVAVPTLICIGYMGQKLMKVWELMV